MDWDLAIERNRGELLPVILGLFAMIGLTEGGAVERVPRPVYRKALGILRAAEAAVRRLIIVMARDLVVEPRPRRPAPARPVRSRKGTFQGKSRSSNDGRDKKPRPPSFTLFDPQKRSDAGKARRRKGRKVEPRIHVMGPDPDPLIPEFLRPLFQTAAPPPVLQNTGTVKDHTVSARSLCRRIFAIKRALENLSREAKRFARWRGRAVADRRPRRERALCFGWPPGWRVRPTHDVHEILKECHWLVRSLPEPNTS